MRLSRRPELRFYSPPAGGPVQQPFLLNLANYITPVGSSSFTVGREFTVTVDAVCTGIRYKNAARLRLYRVSDHALLATNGDVDVGGLGENTYTWATPVNLTAGALYRAATYIQDQLMAAPGDHPDGPIVVLTSMCMTYGLNDVYPDTDGSGFGSSSVEPIILA